MRAIAVIPGTRGLKLIEVREPSIAPDQVKLQVLEVGICGTDRAEAAGGRALAPEGRTHLVIGHEMLGQVVETGEAVSTVRAGDLAVLTVRRKCSRCLPCSMGRPDMCRTGQYRERGIWGLDGFQTEFVADSQDWLVPIPPELASTGVLAEPLSVVEKAIDEAVKLQSVRLPDAAAGPEWLRHRRCLVAGIGPIGLLSAVALRLRGAEVFGLDILDPGNRRARWLGGIGGRYVDGREIRPERLDKTLPPMDLILEATGVARLAFNLLDVLAPGGICVLTGIPEAARCLELPAPELMRAMVLTNLALLGSVNAARGHFQMAVDDLARARLVWPGHMEELITHRRRYDEAPAALNSDAEDEIKAVIQWSRPNV
jgi:threonine dehydrogenase-like Zn-dependent dehydrogenase